MPKDPLSEEDVKLLYVLLDATDAEGSLNPEHRGRWNDLRRRFNSASAAALGPDLYRLLADHSTTGALKESWIKARWLALCERTENRCRPERRRLSACSR
jgi:hypothetical protein